MCNGEFIGVTSYVTPGVYYERADVGPPRVVALRTDVVGFVGIARKGPLHTAVPVTSWRQFQAFFGDFTGAGYLAYAVRAFFENGGRRCWVVRVASPAAAVAGAVFTEFSTGPTPPKDVWRVEASSPGSWGGALEVTMRVTHHAQTVSLGGASDPEFTVVASVSRFARGTLVRISQDGTPDPAWKVVSDVDAAHGRLIWVSDPWARRLPHDAPLTGFPGSGPLFIQSVEYTLLVRESGRLLRTYEELSLVPEHPRYGPFVLRAEDLNADPGAPLPQPPPSSPEPVAIHELRDPTALAGTNILPLDLTGPFPVRLAGGCDGLATLSADDFLGADDDPMDSDVVRLQKRRGLRALDQVDEVSILTVPDIQIRPVPPPRRAPLPPCVPDPCMPGPPPASPAAAPVAGVELPPVFSDEAIYRVQVAQVALCESLGDRIALLDPPFSASRDDTAGAGAIRAWRERFDSKYAALYYPWMRVVDPLVLNGSAAARADGGLTREIPPCGHVAGQYARTDLSEGVHKAPANAALVWIQDVTVAIDDAVQGVLNPSGINAIRTLPGRGIRIFGADGQQRPRLAVRPRPPADDDDRKSHPRLAPVGRLRAERRHDAGQGAAGAHQLLADTLAAGRWRVRSRLLRFTSAATRPTIHRPAATPAGYWPRWGWPRRSRSSSSSCASAGPITSSGSRRWGRFREGRSPDSIRDSRFKSSMKD